MTVVLPAVREMPPSRKNTNDEEAALILASLSDSFSTSSSPASSPPRLKVMPAPQKVLPDEIERRHTEFTLPWVINGQQWLCKLLIFFDCSGDIGPSRVLSMSPHFHQQLARTNNWDAPEVPEEMRKLRRQRKLSYALALPCGFIVDLYAHEKTSINNSQLAYNWPVCRARAAEKEQFTTDKALRYALHTSANSFVRHDYGVRCARQWIVERKLTLDNLRTELRVTNEQPYAPKVALARFGVKMSTLRNGLNHLFELVPPEHSRGWDERGARVQIVQSLKGFDLSKPGPAPPAPQRLILRIKRAHSSPDSTSLSPPKKRADRRRSLEDESV